MVALATTLTMTMTLDLASWFEGHGVDNGTVLTRAKIMTSMASFGAVTSMLFETMVLARTSAKPVMLSTTLVVGFI